MKKSEMETHRFMEGEIEALKQEGLKSKNPRNIASRDLISRVVDQA